MEAKAKPTKSEQSLAERLLAGDKRALARGITLVENDDPAGWELVREVYPHTGKARIIGFTGPPGVGKSTLIGALVKHARERDRQVAMLSVDPSSPFTQGRCSETASGSPTTSSTRASTSARWPAAVRCGGLSEATLQAALLMDASGKEDVFVEK